MNLLLCLSIVAAVVVIWCTVPALWVLQPGRALAILDAPIEPKELP